MKYFRRFLCYSSLLSCLAIFLFFTDRSYGALSSRDDLLDTQSSLEQVTEDGIGSKRVSEDPTAHSLAHNTHQATRSIAHDTHQATKSILHNTHQGTKKVLHTTTNGLKEGANYVTGSVADGVSVGAGAVSDFFNKIGGGD